MQKEILKSEGTKERQDRIFTNSNWNTSKHRKKIKQAEQFQGNEGKIQNIGTANQKRWRKNT